jgi:hypothetical protein
LSELKTPTVLAKINNYKNKWARVFGIGRSGLVQAFAKYQAPGQRNSRRSLKKLLDCYFEAGAGHEASVLEGVVVVVVVVGMTMMMMLTTTTTTVAAAATLWLYESGSCRSFETDRLFNPLKKKRVCFI